MSMREYQMYVGGQWVRAASGRTMDVTDPATEQVISRVPAAGTFAMTDSVAGSNTSMVFPDAALTH